MQIEQLRKQKQVSNWLQIGANLFNMYPPVNNKNIIIVSHQPTQPWMAIKTISMDLKKWKKFLTYVEIFFIKAWPMYVTGGTFESNGTTRVPKSVPRAANTYTLHGITSVPHPPPKSLSQELNNVLMRSGL